MECTVYFLFKSTDSTTDQTKSIASMLEETPSERNENLILINKTFLSSLKSYCGKCGKTLTIGHKCLLNRRCNKGCDLDLPQELLMVHDRNFEYFGHCQTYMHCLKCSLPINTPVKLWEDFVLRHVINCSKVLNENNSKKCQICKQPIFLPLLEYHTNWCGKEVLTDKRKFETKLMCSQIARTFGQKLKGTEMAETKRSKRPLWMCEMWPQFLIRKSFIAPR
jgi:hypothetical protein